MAQSTITVHVQPFARYAEVLGEASVRLDLPPAATVGDAVAAFRAVVSRSDVLPVRPMVAVNLEHVQYDRPVQDGDLLALLPPLAGG